MAQTALETLIERLKQHEEIAANPYMVRGIKLAIKQATELLPKERKDILDAWVDGGSTLSAKNATQYFNQTFNGQTTPSPVDPLHPKY